MGRKLNSMAILVSMVATSALLLNAAQKKVYQCISLPGGAGGGRGAAGGGRGAAGRAGAAREGAQAAQSPVIKDYLVKVDLVSAVANPGLVFLVDGLESAGQGVVIINGNKYEIPPVPGGLYAKVIIPIQPVHLQSGLNRVSFQRAGSAAYRIYDAQIQDVAEKSARVADITYLPLSAATNIRDFDFVTDPKGVGEYRRKESQLIDWAKRGQFRFYRAGVDFNNLDRMFEMFKEGHFNFVMLQIATPEDLQSPQYKRYKEFFDRCHAAGIKVMYDGGNGSQPVRLNAMTLESLVLHPEWIDWISKDEYGIPRWRTPGRLFWTDVGNQAYRAECLKFAGIAMDAGADAAYFDWAIGNTSDLVRFFTELRQLTDRKKINWPMYGNCKGNILVEELCDLMKTEAIEEPGIWDGKWVHNVSQAKFYYAAGFGWKPYESKYEGADPGSPNPGAHSITDGMKTTWRLPMAEAWSFQSHWVIAEAGRQLFQGWVLKNNEVAMKAWREICQYNSFFDENQGLYTDVRTATKIALLAPPAIPSYELRLARTPLYDALGELNFTYDVVLISRLIEANLAGYKAVVIPDVPWLSDSQIRVLEKFKQAGGQILTVGSAENLRKLATATLPASIIQDIQKQPARDEFKQALIKVSGEAPISIQNAAYVISNLVKKTGSQRLVAHFVNYSQPVDNMNVKLSLAGLVGKVDPQSIRLLSPDGVSTQLRDVSVNGTEVTLTIPKLDTYDVVVLN